MPKNTPFQQQHCPHWLSQGGKGAPRCRRAGSEEALHHEHVEESQNAAQTPLGSHPVCVCVCMCVTACSVCADRASSVGEYAPQITPLERLRVGKQSSAKRWCPGPRWVLTHNASRGPAGCCGLSFIFYKACCLLQHVPSAQAGVTSCSPGLLDMAPHSSPACHQPDLLTPELPTRSPCQLPT